jgi:integrase
MTKPKKFTAISIEAIKPASIRQEIRDPGCAGLYLIVQPSGAKSWAFRYRHGDKPRKLTLGSWFAGEGECPNVALGMPLSLAGARKLAVEAAAQVAAGIDPGMAKVNEQKAARQQESNAIETVVADFIRLYAEKKTKAYSAKQAAGFLRREVVSKWAGRSVQDIKRRDIIELLDGIVERGSPISANRTLSHISKFFAWCVSRDIIEVSPAIGVERPAPETAKDRVLSDDELRLVWIAAGNLGETFGAVVRTLILTLQRRGEVAGMTRKELNGNAWTIPASRAKNSVETIVPLAPETLDLISSMPDRGNYIFTLTGASPVTSFCRGMERLNKEVAKLNGGKPLEAWTLHDLRRTGATGMQKLGVQMHVTEKILNHVNGSFRGIVGVYQRHDYADERRVALERWARHVIGLTVDKSQDYKIVTFPRR